MLKINNLAGFGGHIAEPATDPNLATRVAAIDFRNKTSGVVDQYGNTYTLRASSSFGAAGLVLPGSVNNGLDITRSGSYTTWWWNNTVGPFTIEFILNTPSAGNTQQIINNYNSNGWYIRLQGGAVNYTSNGSEFISTTTAATYPSGTKFHVALQRNGAALEFFINGVRESFAVSSAAPTQKNQAATLGCWPSAGGVNPFLGDIESMRAYSSLIYPASNITPPTELII